MDRTLDCPGPCNPRNNKVCRANCIDYVVSILEELPPCIRMKLCQEDLLTVFGKSLRDGNIQGSQNAPALESGQRFKDSGSLNRRTQDDAASRRGQNATAVAYIQSRDIETETSKFGDGNQSMGATSEHQSHETTREEQSQTCQEETTQTEEECLCQKLLSFFLVAAGTISSNVTNWSIAIWNKMPPRGSLSFGSSTSTSCSCRLTNAIIYMGMLIFLATFAPRNYKYQLFLSSQICGIIAIVCWRFARSVSC